MRATLLIRRVDNIGGSFKARKSLEVLDCGTASLGMLRQEEREMPGRRRRREFRQLFLARAAKRPPDTCIRPTEVRDGHD